MAVAGALTAVVRVRSVFVAAGVIVVIAAIVTVVMFRGAPAGAVKPEPQLETV